MPLCKNRTARQIEKSIYYSPPHSRIWTSNDSSISMAVSMTSYGSWIICFAFFKSYRAQKKGISLILLFGQLQSNFMWLFNGLSHCVIEQFFPSRFCYHVKAWHICTRCLMVSTHQADSRCFYFRIPWILMERPCCRASEVRI